MDTGAPTRVRRNRRDQQGFGAYPGTSQQGSTLPGRHFGRAATGQYGQRDGGDLANFLGWFSIGLGLAQLASPGGVARMIGVKDDDRTRDTMRAVGLRELATGFGILLQPNAGWVGMRVAGDAMDLALLDRADSSDRTKTIAAAIAVIGVGALDVFCTQRLARSKDDESESLPGAGYIAGRSVGQNGSAPNRKLTRVKKSVTINRSVEELYSYWRDFANLPEFMRHLESVQVIDRQRSHWKASAPAGRTVEWDAEITEDTPNERIAWRSLGDADVYNAGSVTFRAAPRGRGTEVHVEMEYAPPGGMIGKTIAKIFREEPSQQVTDDLRAFKQVMETGEIVLSDATVHDHPHPAQPSHEHLENLKQARGTR
jgi:uncharacterized membrane protein